MKGEDQEMKEGNRIWKRKVNYSNNKEEDVDNKKTRDEEKKTKRTQSLLTLRRKEK